MGDIIRQELKFLRCPIANHDEKQLCQGPELKTPGDSFRNQQCSSPPVHSSGYHIVGGCVRGHSSSSTTWLSPWGLLEGSGGPMIFGICVLSIPGPCLADAGCSPLRADSLSVWMDLTTMPNPTAFTRCCCTLGRSVANNHGDGTQEDEGPCRSKRKSRIGGSSIGLGRTDISRVDAGRDF